MTNKQKYEEVLATLQETEAVQQIDLQLLSAKLAKTQMKIKVTEQRIKDIDNAKAK